MTMLQVILLIILFHLTPRVVSNIKSDMWAGIAWLLIVLFLLNYTIIVNLPGKL